MNIKLYTTLGCHLCEQALELIHELQAQGVTLEVDAVEIADSEQLMEAYGIRIPVIADSSEREIGWPFNLEELHAFLGDAGT